MNSINYFVCAKSQRNLLILYWRFFNKIYINNMLCKKKSKPTDRKWFEFRELGMKWDLFDLQTGWNPLVKVSGKGNLTPARDFWIQD